MVTARVVAAPIVTAQAGDVPHGRHANRVVVIRRWHAQRRGTCATKARRGHARTSTTTRSGQRERVRDAMKEQPEIRRHRTGA
jgi:hypothetical protein